MYTTLLQGRFGFNQPLDTRQFAELHVFSAASHQGEPGVPGYFCKWEPTLDGTGLQWREQEEFSMHTEWLQYLIDRFFTPWGIVLNGIVTWQGEVMEDRGSITVMDNVISVKKE